MSCRTVSIALLLCGVFAPACRPAAESAVPEATAGQQATSDVSVADGATGPAVALQTVLAAEHRSADNRARDPWRHPAETLEFFEVNPDSTVVELWPGSGWYTEILAPYVAERGKLVVTLFDSDGPPAYYGTRLTRDLLARFKAQPEVFRGVETVTIPQQVAVDAGGKITGVTIEPFVLGEPGTADVVLTFRNSHGWLRSGAIHLVYQAAFDVLKPGGVFGVEQHRAPEGVDPTKSAETGYLPESAVIEAALAVGFVLDSRSEMNANPRDTRDYPHGVWSLPPTLRGGDVDREKYVAIGESDRMTLKFRKPGGR